MKKKYSKTLKFSFLLLFSLAFIHLYSQNSSFTTSGQSAIIVNSTSIIPSSPDSGCDYISDDGSNENSVGLIGGGDIMWMVGQTAIPGCEQIHTVSVAWGQMANGGSCRVMIFEDPTDDGDPSDAIFLQEVTTTVADANTGIFTDVSFPPTVVEGGFFVAALIENQLAGEYPAPLDQTSSAMSSYYVGSGAYSFDIFDLTNNSTPPILSDDAGLPGNVLLRCVGEPITPVVPLSNSGILIGFALLGVLMVFGRRLI